MSQFETIAIRTQTEQTNQKEHSTPLFLTSSFTYDDAAEGAALFNNEVEGNIYSRFSNPNVDEFANKMNLLEGGEMTIATATGMGAIFVCLSAHVQQGDHILASKSLFGNTLHILQKILPKWGVTTTFVDLTEQDQWEDAFQENTKWVFVETPSNPTLDIVDIEWLAKLSHTKNAKLIVDNCFCTPYLQKPLALGADLVIHSATKWIDGQGRVLGGSITGSKELVNPCYDFIRRTGISLSPFNAWVLSKSLETLAIRMDRHCANALKIAEFLERHAKIEKVVYPFLASYPQNDIAKKQMTKGGGIVTVYLKGGKKEGAQFLDALSIFSLTGNLGDTRSIASHPSSTTHSKLSDEDKKQVGIQDNLIRFSVGLEHVDDLLADIEQALNQI